MADNDIKASHLMMSSFSDDNISRSVDNNSHTNISTTDTFQGSNSTQTTTTLLSREEQLVVCMMRQQSRRDRGAVLPVFSAVTAAADASSTNSTQDNVGQQLRYYLEHQGLLSTASATSAIDAASSRYPPVNDTPNQQVHLEGSQVPPSQPAPSALEHTNQYLSLIQQQQHHQLQLQQQQQLQQLSPELQAILNLHQQQKQAPSGPQATAAGAGSTAQTPPSIDTGTATTAPTDTSADQAALIPTPANIPIAVPQPFGRDGQAESFPGKLYRLLAEVERAGNTHIISFTPNGRGILIHDPEAFMTDIAPTFFSQKKFTSFRRQLSFYGFDRISADLDRGAFTHPSFLRGRPELLVDLRRQIVVVPRGKKT
jgi:hypothetical protein